MMRFSLKTSTGLVFGFKKIRILGCSCSVRSSTTCFCRKKKEVFKNFIKHLVFFKHFYKFNADITSLMQLLSAPSETYRKFQSDKIAFLFIKHILQWEWILAFILVISARYFTKVTYLFPLAKLSVLFPSCHSEWLACLHKHSLFRQP